MEPNPTSTGNYTGLLAFRGCRLAFKLRRMVGVEPRAVRLAVVPHNEALHTLVRDIFLSQGMALATHGLQDSTARSLRTACVEAQAVLVSKHQIAAVIILK